MFFLNLIPYSMSLYIWETIAAVLSLGCVWLAAKNKVSNWPVAMAASIVYAYVFYQNRFYSETYLQGVFFVFQSYGWWFWSELNSKKAEKSISNIPKSQIIPLFIAFLIFYIIWIKVYTQYYPNAQQPYLDTFLTVLSITALYMQARRWVENWYLWILADLCYVPMFFWGKQYITAVLYGLFIALATKGLFIWKYEMKKAD